MIAGDVRTTGRPAAVAALRRDEAEIGMFRWSTPNFPLDLQSTDSTRCFSHMYRLLRYLNQNATGGI
jgi:hypothetical protein